MSRLRGCPECEGCRPEATPDDIMQAEAVRMISAGGFRLSCLAGRPAEARELVFTEKRITFVAD